MSRLYQESKKPWVCKLKAKIDVLFGWNAIAVTLMDRWAFSFRIIFDNRYFEIENNGWFRVFFLIATTTSFYLVFRRTTFLWQLSVTSPVPGTLIRFWRYKFKNIFDSAISDKNPFYGTRVTLLFVNIFGDIRVVPTNFRRKLTFVFAVYAHNNLT